MIKDYDVELANIDNMVKVRSEQADAIRNEMSEYQKEVKIMREMYDKLDKINQPKKKWWQFFKKAESKKLTSAIYEMTYGADQPTPPTELQLAERRAYLDGFSDGRHDGDSHKAYRLWRKMKEYT